MTPQPDPAEALTGSRLWRRVYRAEMGARG